MDGCLVLIPLFRLGLGFMSAGCSSVWLGPQSRSTSAQFFFETTQSNQFLSAPTALTSAVDFEYSAGWKRWFLLGWTGFVCQHPWIPVQKKSFRCMFSAAAEVNAIHPPPPFKFEMAEKATLKWLEKNRPTPNIELLTMYKNKSNPDLRNSWEV